VPKCGTKQPFNAPAHAGANAVAAMSAIADANAAASGDKVTRR